MSKPFAASLLITENCNMACTYCFEEPRLYKTKMTKEVARLSVDYLFENAKASTNPNSEQIVNITLFGGEPMMNFEILKYVMTYSLSKKESTGIGVTMTLITNGTILNEDMISFLRSHYKNVDLNIQLSVDGIKETHDSYRIFSKGKGSFDTIEANLKGWKAIFKSESDLQERLNIHGCFNKQTLSRMFEGFKYFKEEWKIPSIWFMPIHSDLSYTSEDVMIYKEQLLKIKDYIIEEIKRTKNKNEARFFAPLDKVFNYPCGFGKPCGAGDSYISITAEGEIYPCHHFYFEDPKKETKMGDIYSGIEEARQLLFTEYDSSDMSCASELPTCDVFGCYRCIADNYSVNGSIFSNIRGFRCQMSHVEKEVTLLLKKEIDMMEGI